MGVTVIRHIRFHSRLRGKALLAVSLFLITSASCVTPVFSQQAQPVIKGVKIPLNTDAGNVLQPEEDELENRDEVNRKKQIKEVPEDVNLDIPEEQDPSRVDTESQVKFQVNRIEITGNSLLSTEELRPLVTPYEGKEVSLNDLGKAVEAINKKYQAKGFLTSQAFIPPQDIEGGVMTIEVVEGVIGVITMTGQKYNKAGIIARDITIHEGDAFNIPDLEKAMNRINRQKPYRLKAILKAGENTGETDLDLHVAERQPWQVTPSWDNQGRPFVGTHRFGVTVSNENLTGIGDRLYTSNYFAAGTFITANGYSVPINSIGTQVGYNFLYGNVNVDLELPNQPHIGGLSHTHSFTVSQPLDKEGVFSLDASFNYKTVNSYLQRTQTNQDKVSSITTGINFNKYDKYGRTFLRLQSDVAFSKFLYSNRSFFKGSAYGTRLVVLPKGLLLILRGNAQFTPDGLPPVEQYQVGGANSVRGFTEGLLVGDRGYNLSSELRFPLPGLKYISPWLNQKVQGAAFFDMGYAWLDKSNINYPGVSKTLLSGAGIGIRAQLTRFLTGFIDFGFPLVDFTDQEPNAQPDVRVHFGVSSNLLPQNYKERGTETEYVNSQKRKEAKAQAKEAKKEAKRLAKLEKQELKRQSKQQEQLAKTTPEKVEPLAPEVEATNALFLEEEASSPRQQPQITDLSLDVSVLR